MPGIAAFGAYIPRLRLQRKAMVEANAWFNPGLKAHGKGERAICNWDEDSLTMAVAAGRDCLKGEDADALGAIYLASTTLPFEDRQNSTMMATALNLSDEVATLDVSSSQRAATGALITALKSVGEPALVVAAEHRRTKAAAPQELLYGDGAAALLITSGDGVAKLIASHSISDDFVDHFRGENESFDYQWEDRWIRDEGYMKLVPRAVDGLFEKAGVTGADIAHFVMPTAVRAVPAMLAKRHGIAETAIRDNLQAELGNTGVAHPIVLLVDALQAAKPGDRILVVGFGQGADALLFEVTKDIAKVSECLGVRGHLARGRAEDNYNRFLAHNKLIEQEGGIRSEIDRSTALTSLYRNKEMLTGMVGGKCAKCGTAQYPKTNICVNPNCGEIGTQEPHPFADAAGSVMTWSADWLTYSPDPPAHYGMVEFAEGGRLLADFTDVDEGAVDVGMAMQMVFRVKEYDAARGFRRYFWKAAPA